VGAKQQTDDALLRWPLRPGQPVAAHVYEAAEKVIQWMFEQSGGGERSEARAYGFERRVRSTTTDRNMSALGNRAIYKSALQPPLVPFSGLPRMATWIMNGCSGTTRTSCRRSGSASSFGEDGAAAIRLLQSTGSLHA
jgi:hypothetical protein